MTEHDPFADHEDAPQDTVRRRRRPDKATVTRLMNCRGQTVTLHETELIEDVDGDPLAVLPRRTSATLLVNLDLLGWTQTEYDDPTITD